LLAVEEAHSLVLDADAAMGVYRSVAFLSNQQYFSFFSFYLLLRMVLAQLLL